jgi:alkylation response protein AidB-like acyl-CoA dehydrogenase
MDLELSNEQRLLRDSAERFASQRYDTAQRRMSLACEGRWSREIWREIADLGWLAVGVPEADGGLGGGPVEIGLVAEALGRALALEPWLDAILVARLVAALGDASQRERLLAPIMEGARRPALAHIEGARFAAEAVSTTAAKSRLTGVKDFVSAPASADDLFVSARTDAGLAVFLVDPSAPGVTIQTFETVDGREAGRVTFDGAEAVRLGSGDATAALAETLDLAAAALSAEAVGCMDSLLAKTIAYTRTRENHRLHAHARAVRQAARGQSGAAAPHGGYVCSLRGGARGHVARAAGVRLARARTRDGRRQVQDRTLRSLRRGERDPVARRDGRDGGTRRRALRQAPARHRPFVRRRRPALAPPRGVARAKLGATAWT